MFPFFQSTLFYRYIGHSHLSVLVSPAVTKPLKQCFLTQKNRFRYQPDESSFRGTTSLLSRGHSSPTALITGLPPARAHSPGRHSIVSRRALPAFKRLSGFRTRCTLPVQQVNIWFFDRLVSRANRYTTHTILFYLFYFTHSRNIWL